MHGRRAVWRTGVRAAVWLRPDLSSPSAPLSTVAWLDSFAPSLMPRTSLLQGIVGGLSVLSARLVADRSERLLQPALGARRDVRRRLAVRGAVAAAAVGLGSLPERDGERLWWSGARDGSVLLRSLAVGGAIHDVGFAAWDRRPGERPGVRTAVAVTSVLAGLTLWADRRLRHRTAAVAPWPIEQQVSLPASAAITGGVVLAGRLLGEAAGATRRGLAAWLGPGTGKSAAAVALNAGLWAVAASRGYEVATQRLGTANRTVEPGYDRPPAASDVSGSPASEVPFDELGRQGRRFVHDALHPDLIAQILGEPAHAAPVRVYVGFDSEPLYPTGRAELALEELERTGAYERRHLLLVSPTGTGWVNNQMVEAAELFARGDIATCAIQYGTSPSLLAVQNVPLGRTQFRILLLGVRERLRAMPPQDRPRVLVFGESLGAWTASDVIMHQGIAGFDHYGIDRALWVGLPWLAKWSRSGMLRGSSVLVPPGTVGTFDRIEQLDALDQPARDRLRAVILSHDNDPIALLGPDLLVKRPSWLAQWPRGRGVPETMRWIPMTTFLHTVVDALNSLVQVPGAFTSYGHDYRADMARFVHAAFRLPPVTSRQLADVEATLVELDLARAARLAGGQVSHKSLPPEPSAAYPAAWPPATRSASGSRRPSTSPN